MKKNIPPFYQGILKFISFIVVFLSINIVIYIDVFFLKNNLSERSLTELAQSLFLIIIILQFKKTSHISKDYQAACVLICGFFSVLLIRELDYYFDMIFHGAWKYFAIPIALIAICFSFFKKNHTFKGLNLLLGEKYFNILLMGIAMLFIFSRIYGMGDFWKGVMNDHYIRDVKNISEEGIELLSYTVLLIGSFLTNREIQEKEKKGN